MDTLSPEVVGLAKILGFGIIVFIIWVMTVKFFERILAQQQVQWDAFINELSKRNGENFQVLNKFAEASEFAGGQISQLTSEIRNNRFCPVIREQQERK
ncbi:MAG: hypothetical protein JW699_07745 [Chitinispirillaceae bacterium]|nr:hypothetical protein [Chitinispirillaceae bacterium]